MDENTTWEQAIDNFDWPPRPILVTGSARLNVLTSVKVQLKRLTVNVFVFNASEGFDISRHGGFCVDKLFQPNPNG